MTDSRAALDMDRLPWLADERKPRARPKPKAGWAMIVPWALLAMLLVAGISYWLGMRSVGEPDAMPEPAAPAATVTLPRAVPEPSRDVELAPMPEVEPVAEPAP